MFSHFFLLWQFFMGWLCSLVVIIISHVLVHFSFAEFLKLGLSITGLIFCNICSLLLTGTSVAQTVESACCVGDWGSFPGLGSFPWRREWKPTPIFLPGESHGQRSLADRSPRGCKESYTTEWLTLSLLTIWILNFLLCFYLIHSLFLIPVSIWCSTPPITWVLNFFLYS